jgi:hypothetical protein
MGARRHREAANCRLAAGPLAVIAVAAALVLSACGESDQSAMRARTVKPPAATGTLPPAAPPVSAGGGAGAFAAPRRVARERRRFMAAIDAACRRVPVWAADGAVARDAEARAGALLREQAWLQALRRELARVPAPRAASDRDLVDDYRRAVVNQIVLDGIVARDLRTAANPRGVDAGEHQNFHNRRMRARIADALHSSCLRRHTVQR